MVNLENITGHDFKESKFRVAVLPLGSTESHGDHLPYGTDTIEASVIAEDLSGRFPNLLVLPTLPYGMSEHYSSFPIALSLRSSTLVSVISDLLNSLYKHDIKRILIINGHDGNIAPIEMATREFKATYSDMKIAVIEAWWDIVSQLLPKNTFAVWNGRGHGGELETSVMLSIRPDYVKMIFAKGVVPDLPEHVQIKWLFHELANTGSTGDPTKGTKEKGSSARRALVEYLVDFLKKMDQKDWKYESF